MGKMGRAAGALAQSAKLEVDRGSLSIYTTLPYVFRWISPEEDSILETFQHSLEARLLSTSHVSLRGCVAEIMNSIASGRHSLPIKQCRLNILKSFVLGNTSVAC